MTSDHLLKPVVWVHGDCLDPGGPALAAHPHAPALWVWDDALLDHWNIGLKRIVFITECLLELPVAIRRGMVPREVIAFAREHGADHVVTTESPSPRFRAIVAAIEPTLPVVVMPVPPFLPYAGPLDLSRFGAYWDVAKRHVFGQPPLF